MASITKYYELPDKASDESFLAGNTITCKVTLGANEVLEAGEPVMIQLSNQSKYKGRIIEFKWIQIGKYKVGEALIVRATPG